MTKKASEQPENRPYRAVNVRRDPELERKSQISMASRNIDIKTPNHPIGMIDRSDEDKGGQKSAGVRPFRDDKGQGFKYSGRKAYYDKKGNYLSESEK